VRHSITSFCRHFFFIFAVIPAKAGTHFSLAPNALFAYQQTRNCQ